MAAKIWPGRKFSDYVELVKAHEVGQRLPAGWVPATTHCGFLDGEIACRFSLRHSLNDFLLKIGGHIGYGVLPKFRRRGFARIMLQEALGLSKRLGISRVLLTCDDDNVGSIKTIESCGGMLENMVGAGPEKPLKRRYWIEVT